MSPPKRLSAAVEGQPRRIGFMAAVALGLVLAEFVLGYTIDKWIRVIGPMEWVAFLAPLFPLLPTAVALSKQKGQSKREKILVCAAIILAPLGWFLGVGQVQHLALSATLQWWFAVGLALYALPSILVYLSLSAADANVVT